MVDNWNNKKLKLTEFTNLICAQVWGETAQNGPKIGDFFEKFCD